MATHSSVLAWRIPWTKQPDRLQSMGWQRVRKTTALTKGSFVGKVMSLLFNMLSMLVIAFLPRSKRLSLSWLQSPSPVILELKKIVQQTSQVILLRSQHWTLLQGRNKHTILTQSNAKDWVETHL